MVGEKAKLPRYYLNNAYIATYQLKVEMDADLTMYSILEFSVKLYFEVSGRLHFVQISTSYAGRVTFCERNACA